MASSENANIYLTVQVACQYFLYEVASSTTQAFMTEEKKKADRNQILVFLIPALRNEVASESDVHLPFLK
jgi:hypothetical protein